MWPVRSARPVAKKTSAASMTRNSYGAGSTMTKPPVAPTSHSVLRRRRSAKAPRAGRDGAAAVA